MFRLVKKVGITFFLAEFGLKPDDPIKKFDTANQLKVRRMMVEYGILKNIEEYVNFDILSRVTPNE